ncbi:peptide/nickel transport system ATP-binding protein [Kribbella sp. VKM Ac-2569]|uniref:ATP-binding cassette domain-containing protein n=1 Tax=Kribbella sp. VKM Ac-2569 TaxID=2512220 RepID=UPI00102CA0B0|nr:ABC transporter ATP-binding protein [Kribbella sp. VKM Ac-2569]RZT16869.1 peptide/nickel transport system ATP-binding protein [Kribbella sp. VKM Ac-2569]
MTELVVRDLHVRIRGTHAVRGVSFAVHKGEVLALVGESGAGKSLTMQAVLGLLPPEAEVDGSIRFAGREFAGASQTEYADLRGSRLGFVPQDALSVLSPVHTIGDQLARAVRSVQRTDRRTADNAARAVLDRVGIDDAVRRARAYPHEFSGGMRQRAVIAMAIVNQPELIVADEPTTALDPRIQAQILDLLTGLRDDSAIVLVTHDQDAVATYADRTLTLHEGRIADSPHVDSIRPRTATPPIADPPLLAVRNLTVRYRGRQEPAVDDVSFDVRHGETVALIGESGCGKSSTASAVLQLRRPEAGEVRLDGTALDDSTIHRLRPAMQPVFQDPYGSLSPRLKILDAIAEPLKVQGRWDPRRGPARVAELMEQVHLDQSLADRRPRELSGGQCQRVGIARALASDPKLLVLDEPVSSLDARVRAGVINLLTELQRDLGLGYLFISHDHGLVEQIAHRTLVMREGRFLD